MRCLLYARVSTDRQAEKDLSIPAQLQFMREYARRQGWRVLGDYIEEGESGRTVDRPALKRLLRHCQGQRGADIVLVHKIDRLARNLVDYATIKAILKQRGIRLVSVAEPFAEGPVGQLMENIIASISEWYSANLGEEIKKAAKTKLQRGEWPAGPPPVGYLAIRNEGKKVYYVHDPDRAPLVRQTFELYGTGQYSLARLAEDMEDRGLRTRRGKPYSPEMIDGLLRRRFYLGKIVWAGQEYVGQHPPLIPESLFYQVQDVLSSRHADTGDKGRHQFLLRGLAVCGSCGSKLTAERHPRGSYYRCMPQARCGEPYIPEAELERELADLYADLQPPRELLAAIRLEVQAICEEREARAESERARLQRMKRDAEAKELKLVDELVRSLVSREAYEKLSKRYLDERRNAEADLAQLDVDYGEPIAFLEKTLAVAGSLAMLHQSFKPKQQKMLARALFKEIRVADREIVGAALNPPFSLFLDGQLAPLFENHPSLRTDRDIFEQLVTFTLSEDYSRMRDLMAEVAPDAATLTTGEDRAA